MGGYISYFSPNNTTYYVSLPLGVTTLPEITYEKGDSYQTVSIESIDGVEGTIRVIVTAASGDQTVYKIICSAEKSSVSHLDNIYLDGEPLSGFLSDVYQYRDTLAVGSSVVPTITYDKGDEFETVQINYGGINATTRIFVTAGDGSTSLYEITFVVELADVATLDSIYIGGVPVDGFSPDVTEYYISLPQGTAELPAVAWVQHDEWQTVSARSGGVNGDYKITVRSQTGNTVVYVLHFSVTTSANTTLSAVYFDGTAFADFDPAVREYDITLAEGVSVLPTVTFDAAESSQKTVRTVEGTTCTIRVIAESGAVGTYVFRFTILKSENAFLNGITLVYIDGEDTTRVPLDGFERETFVYNVVLTTAICPGIEVEKDPTQQVMITKPVATGEARIVVTPESGAPNTYIIRFTSSVLPQLSAIYADGVLISGFNPAVTDYEVTYTDALPVITFEKSAADIAVTAVTAGTTTKLYVKVSDGEQVYTITCSRLLSGDATLRSISINGSQVAGFSSDILDYDYPLTDDTYPLVTYERNNSEQHVVAGLASQYVYSIVVVAADGASKTYNIHYQTSASEDATLLSLSLDGVDMLGEFDADFVLARLIEKGADLPVLTYTKREGQTVSASKTSRLQQQVIVVAESGASLTYTVNYAEQSETNALLRDIRMLVGGRWQSVQDFDKNTFTYNVTLPWRTASAPCIWAVQDKPNQEVTINYGAANGATTLHVLAEDGQTQDYTINFSVTKSANTRLAGLTIDGDEQNVDETDLTFDVPFGTTEPYELSFEKAEAEQYIEYVAAPIDGVTKIIVTAENGDKRTYSIRYNVLQPQGENKILTIHYCYLTAGGETINDEMVPVPGENVVSLPYGAQSFTVTSVDKNYDEQSVVFYNGGIRRGATIMVYANRDNEASITYTIKPQMPEFEAAGKLQDLKFKGTTVPNFRPDVYNYMINVTEQPATADFTCTAYNGATVTPSDIDATKKQITFAVEGGETYSVCWFYLDNPHLDFSGDWVKAAKGNGYKPDATWKVPADYSTGYDWNIFSLSFTYSTGKEVVQGGNNGVTLSTLRGASMNGSMPGMMTQGTMAVSLTSNGNSTSSMTYNASTGVQFRNSPERFALDYRPLSATGISDWSWIVTLSNGSSHKNTTYSGNYNSLGTLATAAKNLDYGSLGAISKITVTLNSCGTENAKDVGGSTIRESSIIMQNLRFIYNSELTAATADGVAMTKSSNTFTLDVDESYVGVPALKFTGAVHDQMQTIEWLNDGEWVNGKLTAMVTNYGENSSDNTVYTVVLQRPAVTSLSYTADFGTYPVTISGDTTYINMPFGVKAMPDFTITPASVHQNFDVTGNGKAITVKVTAEDGSTKTDVYVFRETRTSDATLQAIAAASLTPAYDPEVTDYTITAAAMPEVTFFKQRTDNDEEVGQTVDIRYTESGATLLVTSADGSAQQTYNIAFTKTTETTNAMLTGIALNLEDLTTFAQSTYEYEVEPSENVSFAKEFAADDVVETLTDSSVVIALSGSEEHTYTLRYPTELSANADLADIKLNGESYTAFLPVQTTYEYETDEQVDVEFVLAEDVQSMVVGFSVSADIRRFTAVVTAENGATKTYTFTLMPVSDNNSALADILVDGQSLADFYPDKLTYTYTIPTASPKQAEPPFPSVAYALGQESQTVTIEPAVVLGDTTRLIVTAENGVDYREYKVVINAEPSHSADLENIIINGESVSGFKPSRTNYSMQVFGDELTVDYATVDPFQTVTVSSSEEGVILTVTAQDGTSKQYEVEIWKAAQSNNANLADISIDGLTISAYGEMKEIEVEPFNEKTYTYRIPLHKNEQIPDISATLQEDAQTIEIIDNDLTKIIRVTAEDGTTQNDYRIIFVVEQSSNVYLQMIYLNGDSLQGFAPEITSYTYALPLGVRELPLVDAMKQEAEQKLAEPETEGMETRLKVTAEDGAQLTYTITFAYTLSDADTLLGIYEGSELIEGFRPDSFDYSFVLPMGVRTVPALDAEPADRWQTVTMETTVTGMQTRYRYTVVSESMRKNVYNVVYEIQRSDVDTLQSVRLDSRALAGFDADTTDYYITLPYGTETLPTVSFDKGDEYQDTASVWVGNDCRITVISESGKQRIYTLHFEFAKSSNALLTNIYADGKPIADNFDPEQESYIIVLPYGTTNSPTITYSKAEEEQRVDLSMMFGVVIISVTAADGVTTHSYLIGFDYALSQEAHLADIMLNEQPLPGFKEDVFEYEVSLPYGTTALPSLDYTPADESAKVELDFGEKTITIEVTSADGEHVYEYVINFVIERSPIDYLTDISLKGKTIEGFHQDTLEYKIEYPVGSTDADFIHAEDVTYTKGDESEMVSISDNDGVITIVVTADNQTNVRVYLIRQTILKRSNSLLSGIMLNGTPYSEFSDSVFSYEYLLFEGELIPTIEAVAQDSTAEVSVTIGNIGEETVIYCTAEDGSETTYRILFLYSDLNTAGEPTSNDCLFKRVAGSGQFLAATNRKGVTVAVYDMYGHRLAYAEVPCCDANNMQLTTDAFGQTVLNNVASDQDGVLLDIGGHVKTFFYVFYDSQGRKVASGKFGQRL